MRLPNIENMLSVPQIKVTEEVDAWVAIGVRRPQEIVAQDLDEPAKRNDD